MDIEKREGIPVNDAVASLKLDAMPNENDTLDCTTLLTLFRENVERELALRFSLVDAVKSSYRSDWRTASPDVNGEMYRVQNFITWLLMELKTNFILKPRFAVDGNGRITEQRIENARIDNAAILETTKERMKYMVDEIHE